MKHFCWFFMLSIVCRVWAADSPQYQSCSNNATTLHELTVCANEEATRVDVELNRIYKFLLSEVRNDRLAEDKIRAAQKAWLAYRDAYIEAMYPAKNKQAEYGSIFPMEVNLLEAKLARQQIEALRELSKQY